MRKESCVHMTKAIIRYVDAVFPGLRCRIGKNLSYQSQCTGNDGDHARSYAYIDAYGRLNCVSSTQVPFHIRRILSNALEIPKSKIRSRQTKDWWRVWRPARPSCTGDLQRFCHMEAKKAKQRYRLYPGKKRSLPGILGTKCSCG